MPKMLKILGDDRAPTISPVLPALRLEGGFQTPCIGFLGIS